MSTNQKLIADALLDARRLTEALTEGRTVGQERVAIVDAKLKRALALVDAMDNNAVGGFDLSKIGPGTVVTVDELITNRNRYVPTT